MSLLKIAVEKLPPSQRSSLEKVQKRCQYIRESHSLYHNNMQSAKPESTNTTSGGLPCLPRNKTNPGDNTNVNVCCRKSNRDGFACSQCDVRQFLLMFCPPYRNEVKSESLLQRSSSPLDSELYLCHPLPLLNVTVGIPRKHTSKAFVGHKFCNMYYCVYLTHTQYVLHTRKHFFELSTRKSLTTKNLREA